MELDMYAFVENMVVAAVVLVVVRAEIMQCWKLLHMPVGLTRGLRASSESEARATSERVQSGMRLRWKSRRIVSFVRWRFSW